MGIHLMGDVRYLLLDVHHPRHNTFYAFRLQLKLIRAQVLVQGREIEVEEHGAMVEGLFPRAIFAPETQFVGGARNLTSMDADVVATGRLSTLHAYFLERAD